VYASAVRQGYLTGQQKEKMQQKTDELLCTYDVDQDGDISFTEFVQLSYSLMY
jgi:Ca2+-binding EF-hand superfamily protein